MRGDGQGMEPGDGETPFGQRGLLVCFWGAFCGVWFCFYRNNRWRRELCTKLHFQPILVGWLCVLGGFIGSLMVVWRLSFPFCFCFVFFWEGVDLFWFWLVGLVFLQGIIYLFV